MINSRLLTTVALGLAFSTSAIWSAQSQAQQTPQVKQQVGELEILADEIEFDADKNQYILAGNVDLKSKDTHLTSEKMTVQLTPKKELVSALCEGKVFIDKKNPEEGTTVTARSQTATYHEVQQHADLKGAVRVEQSSPRLAKPAVIIGDKVDLDLKAGRNVVLRGPGAQAKVHIEPKGEAGKPVPEPVDLTADRIEMNSNTQQYVATGKPAMIRPSSQLRAKIIRFELDDKGTEVKIARAEEDVVIDNKSENGSLLHATGNLATYRKPENLVTLDGAVAATVTRPGDEQPSTYAGDHFEYNLKSGGHKLSRAKVTLRQEKKEEKKPDAKDGD